MQGHKQQHVLMSINSFNNHKQSHPSLKSLSSLCVCVSDLLQRKVSAAWPASGTLNRLRDDVIVNSYDVMVNHTQFQ